MIGTQMTYDDILDDIGNWLARVTQEISDSIVNAIAPVLNSVSVMIDDIIGSINRIIDPLIEQVANIFTEIEIVITGIMAGIADTLETQIGKIETFFSELIEDSLGFIESIYDRVVDTITDVTDTALMWLEDAYDSVAGAIETISQDVLDWIEETYNSVTESIQEITDSVTESILGAFDIVDEAVTNLVDQATDVVVAIYDSVTTFIDEVIGTIGGGLDVLLEATSDIPGTLEKMGENFKEAVENFIGTPLSDLPDTLWSSFASQWETLHGAEQDQVVSALNNSYLSSNSPPRNNDELRESFNALVPESGFMRGIFLTLFGVLGLVLSIGSITSANAQLMLQEYAITSPYALMQPADIIRANHFGLMNDDDAKMDLRRHGHSILDADRLVEIGKVSPPEGEALALWKRGIYSEAQLDKVFDRRGWLEVDRNAMKTASDIIPPIQDLITMSVREVFTPAVAERFGQYEDFPDEFGEWAAKQGITEEWAQRYWASHWALPSVQMGFEMLHRRVIDESDMGLLLKSADVMPFWRDKITAISYSPFTRVDIRRMHQVGVLSDDDLLPAYQDIGYNEEKAQKLADFTIKLNDPEIDDDDEELAGLTRTAILNFYKDGVIDRTKATNMLTEIGVSPEAAFLYLNAIDMDDERLTRRGETDLILLREEAGQLTLSQAQDALRKLGLQQKEYDKALAKLVRQSTVKTRLPTKADLSKMLTQGIISNDIFKQTLLLLGYSPEWADRLTRLIGGKDE